MNRHAEGSRDCYKKEVIPTPAPTAVSSDFWTHPREETSKAQPGCKSTCYGATCDYWDGGYWGTCSALESTWGCDCGGCSCDGCPQGDCGSAPFDVKECPLAGNAACDPKYNTAECAWDGGDCCRSTCEGVNCGKEGFGFQCLDPKAGERFKAAQHQMSSTTAESKIITLPHVFGAVAVSAFLASVVAAHQIWRVKCRKGTGAATTVPTPSDEEKPVAEKRGKRVTVVAITPPVVTTTAVDVSAQAAPAN